MIIGYMRVSTTDQNLDSQKAALEQAGAERIFEDKMSGRKAERPGLDSAMDHMRPGDILVITRLDRLGRSLRNLMDLTATLESKGVQLRSLKESIDTSTPTGRLFFHMLASLAEFQADLTRERTKAGLEAARKRGHLGGRKPTLDGDRFQRALALYDSGKFTVAEIAKEFGICRATFYNLQKRYRKSIN